MYKNETFRTAYHKLRPLNEGKILAFIVGEFVNFVLSDAHEVGSLLGEPITKPNGYDIVAVHERRLQEVVERLTLRGKDVVVFEKVVSRGRSTFRRV